MAQSKKLKQLNTKWIDHFTQLYAREPKILVPGEGPQRARIALVGEAPGKDETLQQRPFVGKAGKNLDEFLEITELAREDIYITNVVKFRPIRVSAKGTSANRTPTAEEIALFKPWLEEELRLIKPAFIVTLGNVALRALTSSKSVIGNLHGRSHTERVLNAVLFPLYHPASVIYNRSLRPVYEQDLEQLKLLIHEKKP